MKRIILPLAFATFMGISMSAQTNNSVKENESTCQKQEQCCKADGKKCDKQIKKDGEKKGKSDRAMRGGKDRFNPFQGIELTADQQAQLQALRDERKRTDSEKAEARKAEKTEQKKQFDEKIKSILTPEQYAQYEKNMTQKADNKGHKKGEGRPRHGGERGQRGPAQKK